MVRYLVMAGTRLRTYMSTFDDPKVAEDYRERAEAWYGPDHPLKDWCVVPVVAREPLDGPSFLLERVAVGEYSGPIMGLYPTHDAAHADFGDPSPLTTPKVTKVEHNRHPFPPVAVSESLRKGEEGSVEAIFEHL